MGFGPWACTGAALLPRQLLLRSGGRIRLGDSFAGTCMGSPEFQDLGFKRSEPGRFGFGQCSIWSSCQSVKQNACDIRRLSWSAEPLPCCVGRFHVSHNHLVCGRNSDGQTRFEYDSSVRFPKSNTLKMGGLPFGFPFKPLKEPHPHNKVCPCRAYPCRIDKGRVNMQTAWVRQ